VASGVATSRSAARRLVEQGAVDLDGEPVRALDTPVARTGSIWVSRGPVTVVTLSRTAARERQTAPWGRRERPGIATWWERWTGAASCSTMCSRR